MNFIPLPFYAPMDPLPGIELNALIDSMGRSVKPMQVKHWLEEYFAESLDISSIKRDEIQLLQC